MLDRLGKSVGWIVLVLMLGAYLFFQMIEFEGNIGTVLTSVGGVAHLVFVIFLQNLTVSLARDNSVNSGIIDDRFIKANELNNKYIKKYNKNKKKFRLYVRALNIELKKTMQEDFLFSKDVERAEELSKRDLRKYNRLKPLQHDISGFGLPLLYSVSRDKKIRYDASYDPEKNKIIAMIKKTLTGVMYGMMTVNVAINITNFGAAMISVAVITFGLIITYLFNMIPPYNKLTRVIPYQVLDKTTLFDSFELEGEKLIEKYKEIEEVEPDNDEVELDEELGETEKEEPI